MKHAAMAVIFCLAWLGLSTGAAAGDQGSHSYDKRLMKTYFIPFEARTYIPVTRETIDDSSIYRIWFYRTNPFIEEALQILQRQETSKTLDESEIRLRVVLFDGDSTRTIIADRFGVAQELESGKRFVLTKEEKEQLRARIESLHGVVDQRPEVNIRD